jgi:hypothetical protein
MLARECASLCADGGNRVHREGHLESTVAFGVLGRVHESVALACMEFACVDKVLGKFSHREATVR